MKEDLSFTEEQIEALNELYMSHGIQNGRYEVIKFIKEYLNLSEVNHITIALRKKFLNDNSIFDKYNKMEVETNLGEKLMKRLSNS